MSQKFTQSDYNLELGLTPTTKAVGSEYVTKVGTDGFSRRTTKKRNFLTFKRLYQKFFNHRDRREGTENTECLVIDNQFSVFSAHTPLPLWLIKNLTFETLSYWVNYNFRPGDEQFN